MFELLLEPLTFDFMQQALAIGLALAIPAAVISCFLVLRGWALMGDAISHAVLPGVILAHIAGIPLVIGAFGAGMLCAVATGYLSENCRVKEDTVMGIVFSGMFGFGVVLFSMIETDLHLDHILFGDMLGVVWSDVINTSIIALLSVSIIVARRRDLLVYAFDPQHAHAIGLPVKWLHYGLLVLLSITIVAGLKAVGIILVIALLIAPGAIAYLLTNRFDHMLIVSVVVAIVASTTGVMCSFYLDSAPAPTIVVVLMLIFIAVFIFAPQYGLLSKRDRAIETA